MAVLKRAAANAAPVYLEWLDSFGGSGWERADRLDDELPGIRSAGLVVKVTETFVTITNSWGNSLVNDALSIPFFAITKVTELEFKGRR